MSYVKFPVPFLPCTYIVRSKSTLSECDSACLIECAKSSLKKKPTRRPLSVPLYFRDAQYLFLDSGQRADSGNTAVLVLDTLAWNYVRFLLMDACQHFVQSKAVCPTVA